MHLEGERKGLWKGDRNEDMCWCASQWIFPLLGVDDVDFAPPYNKVCKWNVLGDVFVLVPGNNGICIKASIDDMGNVPDGILIS